MQSVFGRCEVAIAQDNVPPVAHYATALENMPAVRQKHPVSCNQNERQAYLFRTKSNKGQDFRLGSNVKPALRLLETKGVETECSIRTTLTRATK